MSLHLQQKSTTQMADINSVLYGIIGKRISELRKLNNDSQLALATKIKLKRSSISNIESGRQQVSLHLLYRIAQIYNTEVFNLVPKVSEVASKVSLEFTELNDILEKKEVGTITRQQIFELLK